MDIKFIEPSHDFNIIPNPNDNIGVMKFLESIGRVCYKSEDRITENSAEKFLKMIFDRGHTSILEHYIFTFEINKIIFHYLLYTNIYDDKYRKLLNYFSLTKHKENDNSRYIISGSLRAFNQLYEYLNENDNNLSIANFIQIYNELNIKFPNITYTPTKYQSMLCNKYNKTKLLSIDDINKLPNDIRERHNWFSVHFTTDRSVTHELVRHRPVSYAQESTRYVNYRNKGYISILPYWIPEDIKKLIIDGNDDPSEWKKFDSEIVVATKAYLLDIKNSFEKYDYFINLKNPKFVPQDLKGKIYDSIKTEINVTTFEYELKHIFKLRCSEGAYPGIREVMIPLLQDISRISNKEFESNSSFYDLLLTNVVENGGREYLENESTSIPFYHTSITE